MKLGLFKYVMIINGSGVGLLKRANRRGPVKYFGPGLCPAVNCKGSMTKKKSTVFISLNRIKIRRTPLLKITTKICYCTNILWRTKNRPVDVKKMCRWEYSTSVNEVLCDCDVLSQTMARQDPKLLSSLDHLRISSVRVRICTRSLTILMFGWVMSTGRK